MEAALFKAEKARKHAEEEAARAKRKGKAVLFRKKFADVSAPVFLYVCVVVCLSLSVCMFFCFLVFLYVCMSVF